MTFGKGRKHRHQHWLYISETELTLFATGTAQDGLPSLQILDQIRCPQPLLHAEQHAHWVRTRVGKTINILLSHSLYQLLLSDVPDVPADELNAAIELKAADLISYELEDAALDVLQLPPEAYRGRMRMAFIVASRRAPLQAWAQALMQQGVRLQLVDIEISQLRNLALQRRSFSESGILYLTAQNSRLLLNYDDEMVLTRVFDFGSEQLQPETVVQDGELELTVSADTGNDIQLDSLALEIRRTFDYYEAQLGLGQLAELLLLCDPELASLAPALANRLGVNCRLCRAEDSIHIEGLNELQSPRDVYHLLGTVYREGLS